MHDIWANRKIYRHFQSPQMYWNKHKISINEFWNINGPLNSSLQKLLNEELSNISLTRQEDFLLKIVRLIGRNAKFSVIERIL